ncbi:beta-1,3-galactosyltransferase 1-like [Antedon mediterranea]|uniref:beta-1,3-galactosyltransferase 1-like n=1 Tax=Antedon mediterranea TaxID=105859 RepID=UPI003AF79393
MKRTIRNLLLLSVVTIINVLLYAYASGSNAFWKSEKNVHSLHGADILRQNHAQQGTKLVNHKQNETEKKYTGVDAGIIYNLKPEDKAVNPGPIYNLNHVNQAIIEQQKQNIIEIDNKVDLKTEENKIIPPVIVEIPKEVVKPVEQDIKLDVKPEPAAVEKKPNSVFKIDPELLAVIQGHHIFPHNFNLVLNHPEACNNEDGSRKDIFLAVLICTIHKNFEQRKAIRETWSNYEEINGQKIITIFLLAKTNDKELQSVVEEENKEFNDLIMEDFQDTYKNLTLKTMMGMKWASMYCPSAKYVMKTDDDMYVSYPNIVNYLMKHPETRKGLAMGFLINGAPIRDPKSKWYMPKETYPGGKYPPFLSGTGYVMSSDVVRKTFIASVDTPFLYLEDVFCATVWDKIGIKPKRHAEFHNWRTQYSFCRYKRILTTHMVPPGEMRRIWNDQKKTDKKCSW